MSNDECNAVVIQRVEVSPGLMIMRVRPNSGELADFKPGQFGVLGLPGSAPRFEVSDPEDELPNPDKLIKRAYSVASSSVSKEYIEFYISIVRSGALTPRLFALGAGDKLFMAPKFKGVFTIENAPETANIVMISTGTGLAPYMSFIRTKLPKSSKERRFAIIHGARHSWDLGYRSELITLSNVCSNFTYIPSVSRPNEEHVEWTGVAGYVQDVWKSGVVEKVWGFAPTPENSHIFLCGNPAMVEAALSLVEGAGFREHKKKEPGEVHLEKW
ncbi:Ferredoxin--NADP(+) reductase [hydrothermal vent metagenome]|uniref:ferredoxin--NADP(+) reductase n=1 Tax=hydrothermal vent metagenome TaxID=652676 RepID=A0A3B1CTJ7_9ZZZZ